MKINGPIWALGAMSGTSLDGVDAALIKTDGETISQFGLTRFRAYTPDEQIVLRAGLGRWPGEAGVAEAASLTERSHIEVLSQFSADLIGFHGQTLAHDPAGRGTHQVGDGAALAEALQTPVVWDFRSADVELGGQGAPLAPFYHFACAKWMGATEPVGFLNLGGVGNLTCVDPSFATPDEEGALTAFDTGPANAPINDLMRARLGADFDRDGALAAQGTPIEAVVADFLTNAYFHKMPPKSLDRDDFAGLLDAVASLSHADAAATLTACATAAVAKAVREAPIKVSTVYVTGGGRHNAVMMRYLAAMVPAEVKPIEAVGLNGDMLEAQAFGYLAVRVARGLPTSCPATTGVAAGIGGGVISTPAEPVPESSDPPSYGQTSGRP